MLKKINGRKARFCNENCAHGFKADRAAGLIYSAYKFPTGKLVNPEPASVIGNHCAYCSATVYGHVPAAYEELHVAAYGLPSTEFVPSRPTGTNHAQG